MSSTILTDDAAIVSTRNGLDTVHLLAGKLRESRENVRQRISRFTSADMTTVRTIAIGSGVRDLSAVIPWDGSAYELGELIAEGRRGATWTYYPSLAISSESYECILVDASEIVPDPDFWFNNRYRVEVTLRRIDGGSWWGVVHSSLFSLRGGGIVPGITFTRTGTAPQLGGDDVVIDVAANLYRADWIDSKADETAPGEPGLPDLPALLLETARTNVQDEDDLTLWSVSGTPVVTGSRSDPKGGTTAYRVEDDDGSAGEHILRAVTFTGDGVKSVVFVVREHTPPPVFGTDGQDLVVWDDTAASARLLFGIQAWDHGVPEVTATAGTYLGKRYVGDGFWAIYGQTTSVTAANTNQIWIQPASVAGGGTGSIDVYRVNAYDAEIPAVSVLDESGVLNTETWTAEFTHPPQEMTMYARFIERGTIDAVDNTRVVHIGAAVSSEPRFGLRVLGNNYRVIHDLGVPSAGATLSAAPSWGDEVELRGVLNADGSVLIGQSINGAAETTAENATAIGLAPAWVSETLRLNFGGAAFAHFLDVKVVRGVATMQEMRDS